MKSICASATKRQKISLCQTGLRLATAWCSHVFMHSECGATELSGSVGRRNRFVLYTYQTCVLLTAVNASTSGVHGPTWGDSKWLFCFCGIQTRTEALFLKRWRNQQRTERLKPLVISECYNSLWSDTITLWTLGQRGDLGVIYCDLSPAGQSPIYANHSGLTLSVAFEIYHDQWGWNELPLDVLLLKKYKYLS